MSYANFGSLRNFGRRLILPSLALLPGCILHFLLVFLWWPSCPQWLEVVWEGSGSSFNLFLLFVSTWLLLLSTQTQQHPSLLHLTTLSNSASRTFLARLLSSRIGHTYVGPSTSASTLVQLLTQLCNVLGAKEKAGYIIPDHTNSNKFKNSLVKLRVPNRLKPNCRMYWGPRSFSIIVVWKFCPYVLRTSSRVCWILPPFW